MKKGGAMELSISTIIVVVLAILMLILGTVMVKKTMCAGISGVDQINDIVKDEIRHLYSSQDNLVVVKEKNNEITKNSYYGVGFGIKNEEEKQDTEFDYEVQVVDLGNCELSEEEAEEFIILGKSGTANIPAGETYEEVIKFNIPKDAPICNLRYEIVVSNNDEVYGSTSFEVITKQESILNSLLC